jgi:thiol:disulfide interchange protein
MRILFFALLLAAQAGSATQKYNPARNADQDIKNAIVEAQKTGKRILLEVGGEWCTWCHVLDKYFKDNPGLTASRDRNYVMLKINFSPENDNKAVLSRYPAIPGYPHFFVLDSDGKLLHSQGTSQLEEGPSYNLARFTAFLDKWAPKR